MTLITPLRARVNGPVVIPGDPDYEDARHVYNFMIDRHPAAIVRCANRHDVQELVRQAGESGLDLAVRGGGHSVAGHGTGNGAIVADLSAMSQILIDPDRGIARAGGGATWAMLNEAAAAPRTCDHRRHRVDHRHCRPNPRRRNRLPDAEVRVVLRQPALRRGGSC